VPISKVNGLTDKPSFTAIIPSTTGAIDSNLYYFTNKISSYETELSSSNKNKECTKLDKYSSSLDSKPLVLNKMEASMIKAPGKRLILPKTISPQANSMSLKNVSNNEISKGHINSSKGKVISRIVYPDANTEKKILPTKPKFLISQDTTQSQIVLVEANDTSQSQASIADAELKHLIPARNLVEYVSALDNNFVDTESNLKNEENYGTKKFNNVNNTDTVDQEYYNETDKESHQGESVLPGRQLLNIDPFLSDSNAIELINDIDTLNKVSTQEDPEKDHIIAEAYIPVSTNNTGNKMEDSDIFFTWGADSLLNDDAVPLPIDSMMMVSPLTVEGRRFEETDMESESSAPSSATDNQYLATPQPNIDMACDNEMHQVLENLDEEFITSILNDIEISPNESTTENVVPEQSNDLLKMIVDDSIGEDAVAQFCNVDFLTLNPQDIEPREDEVVGTAPSDTQEETVTIAEADVAPVQKRRGPGRPRKERTEGKVKKPVGRPAGTRLNLDAVMADHHNYSTGGASNSNMTANERRYRRMRDLNNVASQRCRLKRKQKAQSALDDLKQEEEKNRELSIKVRLLEEQVAALKKHFINKISNPRSVATTSAEQASHFSIEQLNRFVDEAANKHLGGK